VLEDHKRFLAVMIPASRRVHFTTLHEHLGRQVTPGPTSTSARSRSCSGAASCWPCAPTRPAAGRSAHSSNPTPSARSPSRDESRANSLLGRHRRRALVQGCSPR
jgi:hypothetical protein